MTTSQSFPTAWTEPPAAARPGAAMGATAVAVGRLPGGRAAGVVADRSGHLCWWDLRTGAPIGRRFAAHEGSVRGLAVAPLATGGLAVVTTGLERRVKVWHVDAGARLRLVAAVELDAAPEAAAATVLPDGRAVAVTGQGVPPESSDRAGDRLLVWNLADGSALGAPVDVGGWLVRSLVAATLADGRAVAVGGGVDGNLYVVDLGTRELVRVIRAHHRDVVGLVTAGLPDGRTILASAGRDGTAQAWDLATGHPVGEPLRGHEGELTAIAAFRDGDRVVALTAGLDGLVRSWDVRSGAAVGPAHQPHPFPATALAVSPRADGPPVVLSGDRRGDVRVWRPSDRPVAVRGDGHRREVTSLAVGVRADRRAVLVTASSDATAVVRDARTGAVLGTLSPAAGELRAVATAALPDGRTVAVTGAMDGTLSVWDLADHTRLAGPVPAVQSQLVSALAGLTAPDGRAVLLSGGHDALLRRWALPDLTPLGPPLSGHDRMITAVSCAALPDGRVVAVTTSTDRSVRAWDVLGWAPLGALDGADGARRAVVHVRPDGAELLVTRHPDGAVRCAHLWSGRVAWTAEHGSDTAADDARTAAGLAVAPLANGAAMVVSLNGSDRTVRAWNVATGDRLAGGGTADHDVAHLATVRPGPAAGGRLLAVVAGARTTAFDLGR